MQLVLVVLLLKVTFIAEALLSLNIIVETLEAATQQGAVFLFGYLGGAEAPYIAKDGAEAYLLAFRVLPQILMFAVIVAILWYYKVLQWLVRGLGLVMQRHGHLWRAGDRRRCCILGMVEAPMVVRAYLKEMSRASFLC